MASIQVHQKVHNFAVGFSVEKQNRLLRQVFYNVGRLLQGFTIWPLTMGNFDRSHLVYPKTSLWLYGAQHAEIVFLSRVVLRKNNGVKNTP